LRDHKRRKEQADREEEERRERRLAELPENLRRLYDWKETADMNGLKCPDEFVGFYADTGQIREEERAEMTKEVKEAWDEMMSLPNL
jgi:hypothetical protein